MGLLRAAWQGDFKSISREKESMQALKALPTSKKKKGIPSVKAPCGHLKRPAARYPGLHAHWAWVLVALHGLRKRKHIGLKSHEFPFTKKRKKYTPSSESQEGCWHHWTSRFGQDCERKNEKKNYVGRGNSPYIN
eukprot:1162098-Pelagomonas_calceolata.AAC.9